MRTTVYWDRIAPTRPAAATDPFDAGLPVRRPRRPRAQRDAARHDGDDVRLEHACAGPTAGKGPNYAPTRLSDYQNFMRALAARYSGRYPGYPFVGYFSVWNEPNLQQFLAPTYDSRGKPKSPLDLRRARPRRLCGCQGRQLDARWSRIGETSPRGRSKPTTQHGVQQTLAPALFAQGALGRPPARQVRRLGASPVLGHRRLADAEGALPERQPRADPDVRPRPRQVVQAARHADLDHRVRVPDEARPAEGRHAGDSRPPT